MQPRMQKGNNNIYILVTWTLMSDMKYNFKVLFTLLKTHGLGLKVWKCFFLPKNNTILHIILGSSKDSVSKGACYGPAKWHPVAHMMKRTDPCK